MYNYNYGYGCGAKQNNSSIQVRPNNSQMPLFQDTQTTKNNLPSLGNNIFDGNQAPVVVANTDYTQGYLKSKIGKRVQIEFLIGTSMLVDRAGTLVDVGISYVVIRETTTGNLVMGDLYAIKFVTFFD